MGLLEQLKKKVDQQVQERVHSLLEPKLNEMIKILQKIEKNTRD